jgi:hypothetical protein
MGSRPDDFETEPLATPSARRATRQLPRVRWRDADGEHDAIVDRTLLVGAARGADLVIADRTVSRLHAELDPRADGLWIRDVGSKNGVRVDGVLVGSACVPDGARIELGDAVISVDKPVETTVDLWGEPRFGQLVGASAPMRELFAKLARVSALESTVLLVGETGTGKELAARAIHDFSARATAPFVVVDCAALPETLLEGELFGVARGAFTGATSARTGALESAAGGTVFLDEIGELPPPMQAKLLRARPPGGGPPRRDHAPPRRFFFILGVAPRPALDGQRRRVS